MAYFHESGNGNPKPPKVIYHNTFSKVGIGYSDWETLVPTWLSQKIDFTGQKKYKIIMCGLWNYKQQYSPGNGFGADSHAKPGDVYFSTGINNSGTSLLSDSGISEYIGTYGVDRNAANVMRIWSFAPDSDVSMYASIVGYWSYRNTIIELLDITVLEIED